MSECDLNAAEVGKRFGLSDDFSSWLEELELVGLPLLPARLPDRYEVGDLFSRLACRR